MKKKRHHEAGMTVADIKRGMQNGTIESACSDTGATSTAGKSSDPFEETGKLADKICVLPIRKAATVSKKYKQLLGVRAPANEVGIVLGFQQTLLSYKTFMDTHNTAVYDKD